MMYRPQDFASLQASNKSLQQQLEAISSRHRATLQQNQQLTSQNQRLQISIQSHIQQDWNELKKEKQHFDFSGDHFSALMRVKDQLRNSLNALQKPPTSFENLHEFASQESSSEKQHNLDQDQYSRLLELIRKAQIKSPAIHQQLKGKLQSYHRSMVQIEEELKETKSRADRFEHQIVSMEDSLKDAKEVNKNMYNQLLEVTLQLQNTERLKSQLSALEEEREQLKTSLQKLEQQNKQKNANKGYQVVQSETQKYEEIRKCYEQIASLRQRLSEAQNNQKDDQTSFISHKAELELANILSKKKLEESQRQVRELKDRLERAQTQLSQQSQGEKILEEYQQETYLLKIKVFALESLQVGQRYKANNNRQLDDFLEKIQPWLENGGDWKEEALLMMAENHSIIKQLQNKLQEDQKETDKLRKKYKSYKQKYQLAEKNQRQKQEQLIESYNLKTKEYNKLIDKMQAQLQRMTKTNTEKSIREMAQMLAVPLQQQLDIVSTQNAFIHNELAMKEQLIAEQGERHETEINQLIMQIQQLKKENRELHKANRQSQSMLLQQNLNLAVSKVQEKAQGKRSRLLSTQKSQTIALEQQITLLNSRLQEQADMLSKETVKNQKLTNLNNSQAKQLQQLKAQLRQLKNQISESLVSNQSPRVNSMGNINKQKDEQVQRLRAQISQIKSQLYRERAFAEEMADRAETSLDETRSYRKRIEQLEQVLKVIDNESKEKGIQIMRLQHEKDVLQRQLQKLQEHLETIKGKANSLKEIEWLQHNKQLQAQVQSLKKDNAEKLQLLIKRQREVQQLRMECDSFLQDNLKLVCIVKEHDIQVKENLLFTQKYQEERNHKAKQLQKKISNLTQDNQILKDLVEELRAKLISLNAGGIIQPNLTSETSQDVSHLKIALVNAQNEARHYQEELQHLHQQRLQDKHAFQNDWERLNTELIALSRELQFYRKGGITPFVGKGSFSSKGVTSEREGSEKADDFHDDKIVKSEIIDLMSELQIKNQVIRQLKQELRLAAYGKKDQIVFRPFQPTRQQQASYAQTSSKAIGLSNRQIFMEDDRLRKTSKEAAVGPDSEEEDRSDVYLRQLFELRQQNQKLMQVKLYNQDKLRDLEQENNVLRLKLLAGQSSRYDYYTGDSKYNYSERPQLPAPMRLQHFSVHSSEHSTPPSYYEVNRSSSSNTEGRGSNPSIPEEQRSHSSIAERQRSKTSIPAGQQLIAGGNVTFKKQGSRLMSKEQISDIQALAPLVRSVEGQGMF